MIRSSLLVISCVFLLCLTISLHGAENPVPSSQSKAVIDVYPNLTLVILYYATISELADGTVLKSGDLVVTEKDIEEQKATIREDLQDQADKNRIFLLEQLVTEKLVVSEAKKILATNGGEVTATNDGTIVQLYINRLAEQIEVDDESIVTYYQENKDLIGDSALRDVSDQIRALLAQQMLQALVTENTETIGQRIGIQISDSWLEENAALSQDNPVGKARANGRISLVDFSSNTCEPCVLMAPVLEALKEKFEGKYDVITIDADKEPILAMRYGISAVPTQIFFDKTGKEVFRNAGFWEQEKVEAKFTEIDAD
ncbi:thioredoxin family protein [Planctomycetota bacterium]